MICSRLSFLLLCRSHVLCTPMLSRRSIVMRDKMRKNAFEGCSSCRSLSMSIVLDALVDGRIETGAAVTLRQCRWCWARKRTTCEMFQMNTLISIRSTSWNAAFFGLWWGRYWNERTMNEMNSSTVEVDHAMLISFIKVADSYSLMWMRLVCMRVPNVWSDLQASALNFNKALNDPRFRNSLIPFLLV